MTDTPYGTSSGRSLSDAEIERLADDVATGEFDVDALQERRRGRPLLEPAPAGGRAGPPGGGARSARQCR